jgi:hypothetical protein
MRTSRSNETRSQPLPYGKISQKNKHGRPLQTGHCKAATTTSLRGEAIEQPISSRTFEVTLAAAAIGASRGMR